MESGVLDKRDMLNMQGRGGSRTGLGSTVLNVQCTMYSSNVQFILFMFFFF